MDSAIISNAIDKTNSEDAFWASLVDESGASIGPVDGGCLIYATAILDAVGSGDLVRIASDTNGGQTEHYGARIDGVIYDFDGPAHTPELWIERFKTNELIRDRQCFLAEGFDGNTDTPNNRAAVKAISRFLAKIICAQAVN